MSIAGATRTVPGFLEQNLEHSEKGSGRGSMHFLLNMS